MTTSSEAVYSNFGYICGSARIIQCFPLLLSKAPCDEVISITSVALHEWSDVFPLLPSKAPCDGGVPAHARSTWAACARS